jgi:hypothetical protein
VKPGEVQSELWMCPGLNLLCCQVAGGLWTGLGWATPVGGQALIRSHGPLSGGQVGPTGQFEDSTEWCVSRFIGSDPTRISCHLG